MARLLYQRNAPPQKSKGQPDQPQLWWSNRTGQLSGAENVSQFKDSFIPFAAFPLTESLYDANFDQPLSGLNRFFDNFTQQERGR